MRKHEREMVEIRPPSFITRQTLLLLVATVIPLIAMSLTSNILTSRFSEETILQTQSCLRWINYLQILFTLIVSLVWALHLNLYRRAAERAQNASDNKEHLLTWISHKLKTPLNTIVGTAELALQKKLEDNELDGWKKILGSGNALLRFVTSLIDMSALENGRFVLARTDYDIVAVVAAVARSFLPRFSRKQVQFSLTLDPFLPHILHGDAPRLRQIMNNLLAVALRLTPSGSVALDVRKEPGPEENTIFLQISVSATGKGMGAMRKEELKHLFTDSVWTDTSTDGEVEGSGLSLSITKKLVERMGGAVMVESEKERGNVLTAQVPQVVRGDEAIGIFTAMRCSKFQFQNHLASSLKPNRKTAAPRDANVLIVDDEPVNAVILTSLLQPHEIRVDAANNGKEALAMIGEGSVHLK
jgi:signal transduction histidine kinase